jgi:hypothetical protein
MKLWFPPAFKQHVPKQLILVWHRLSLCVHRGNAEAVAAPSPITSNISPNVDAFLFAIGSPPIHRGMDEHSAVPAAHIARTNSANRPGSREVSQMHCRSPCCAPPQPAPVGREHGKGPNLNWAPQLPAPTFASDDCPGGVATNRWKPPAFRQQVPKQLNLTAHPLILTVHGGNAEAVAAPSPITSSISPRVDSFLCVI